MAAKRLSTVKDYVATLDEQTAQDSRALIKVMQAITGRQPKLWNVGTIGFDTYHFKYDTGREGDCFVLGFYPRKGKTTIYLMDGTGPHAELLARLGKYSATRVCLYFKRLDDLELPVLKKILQRSRKYLKAQDGKMHRVLK